MPKWNIIVENYRPNTKPGSLLSYGDININQKIIIMGCRFFDGANGKFVSYPSKRVENKEGGKDAYYPHAKIPDEDLRSEILAAFKNEFEKHESPQQQSTEQSKEPSEVWDE